MERCLVGGIRIWIYYIKNQCVSNITGKTLFEGLIPSGSRDKKRPAFKPTFEREWNSILYDMEERFAELLFKEFVEAIISFIF